MLHIYTYIECKVNERATHCLMETKMITLQIQRQA